MTDEQQPYLFVQVAGQHICLIEEGDITFAPEKKVGSIQTAGCTYCTQ